MLNIWEQQEKETLGILPIIPIIVYHGHEDWKARNLRDYFKGGFGEEINRFIPSFDYLLTNLQQESQTSIRNRFRLLSLQMAFLLMKSSRDEQLLENMTEIFQGIESMLKDAQGKIFLEQIFVYLFNSAKIENHRIMDEIRNISYEAGEFADTIAGRLFRQGQEQNLRLNISKLLLNGIKAGFIAKALEIPLKQVKEIQEKLKLEGKLK